MTSGTERGSVLVETAILVPLLLVLVMGIVDLGRSFSAQITLRDAASEGALFATSSPGDPNLIRARVLDSAENLNIDPGDVEISCDDPKTVVVTVSHDVDMLTFVGEWFGPSIVLKADSTGTVITSGTCMPDP